MSAAAAPIAPLAIAILDAALKPAKRTLFSFHCGGRSLLIGLLRLGLSVPGGRVAGGLVVGGRVAGGRTPGVLVPGPVPGLVAGGATTPGTLGVTPGPRLTIARHDTSPLCQCQPRGKGRLGGPFGYAVCGKASGVRCSMILPDGSLTHL
jgi:hypothetical protein